MALASGSRPLRLAFVGQGTFFEACSLEPGLRGFEPVFFEFRRDADAGALRDDLEAFDADVAVVFRPEIVPAGALRGLRARTVGFLTEPLPRRLSGAPVHEDLERRLWELRHVDASNFDRVISFDPHVAATAHEVVPVWRSLPLPVADRYFAPLPLPAPTAEGPRPLFVGRSTPHREALLAEAKQQFDLLHLAFGVDAGALGEALRRHDVGINLHNNPYPSFENRVGLHLAAGHLVLSEWLHPTHGLEPNIDFVVVQTSGELLNALVCLRRFPGLWHRVRVRGRRKAEQFRASRVYPRLVHDLFADLNAFGSVRAAA
jgi:hypothetical protein